MYIILLLFLVIGCQVSITSGCDMDQWINGCRIYNRQCSCGHGCKSEYRYENMAECMAALRGRKYDHCFKQPCQHGGLCIQITQNPGYKCLCQGTGYFGTKCERVCPVIPTGAFPHECIVI